MGLLQRLEEATSNLFRDIGLMNCEPVKLRAHQSHKALLRFLQLPKGKEELERMLEAGIIEEVTEPTECCAPMVPVFKHNGKVKICVDPRKLKWDS